ncbi:hypothetical protein JTE90_014119 [Oedothorax gibbosus]|uniref:Uncharacterized protein n=1 Tax=Oedothorax gibbosus TaxID=931172 RepID=A0AAV6V852_9ARAC|nr:hypothetical protein JTE90_014119 [Oedothorax gibbosus]
MGFSPRNFISFHLGNCWFCELTDEWGTWLEINRVPVVPRRYHKNPVEELSFLLQIRLPAEDSCLVFMLVAWPNVVLLSLMRVVTL